jgi:arabinogalactan oligomer/maltooligosaccharide transport system permease protein
MSAKKVKNIGRLTILHLVYIILCLLALIPVIYVFTLSVSKGTGALSTGLLPKSITPDNYVRIFREEPFLQWLGNSVVLSVGTMILAMLTAVPAAYAYSRYRFKQRGTLLKSLLLLNAFPQILSMFAIFRLYKLLGLLNTRIGLIIVYAGSMCIFSIWNMKGYFDTIPVEIEEAARMDGATDLQTIAGIILPLARPAIIVTCVMVLIFVWNEYIFSTTFLLQEGQYSLAGGLYQLQSGDYSRSWPLFSAAAILVSVPILLVFFRIQKYMVSGLTAGGVKG